MSVESAIPTYPEHWELTTLGRLCAEDGGGIQTGPFGSQLHAADYIDDGIPSIMPKNISVEGISTDDIACITDEDAERLTKYLVQDGDIIYSRRGDVEKCSLVTEIEDGWLCGTGCLRVRLGVNSKVSPIFIHAYLSHPAIREWIVRHAIGATMPNLNTSILSDVPVLIPSDDEIAVIENVWSNTTNKIVLNRHTNQTLEQIAQAIFKSWFVDFEPVKAKIEAKQNGQDPERAAMRAISGKTDEELDQLSPEQRQQLASTAAFFPDELVDSELGEIPKGWEWKPLYETAEYINGAAFKSIDFSSDDQGLPIVKIAELKQGLSAGTKFATGEFKDKYRINNDDVLYSWSGSPETSLEVFKWFGGEAWLNQHIFKLNFESLNQKYFTYFLLKHMKPELIRTAQQKQTTGLGHVTVADMKRIKTVFPSSKVLQLFSEMVGPIYEKNSLLQKEIISLSGLRDSLLPKLLSGYIELNDKQAMEVA